MRSNTHLLLLCLVILGLANTSPIWSLLSNIRNNTQLRGKLNITGDPETLGLNYSGRLSYEGQRFASDILDISSALKIKREGDSVRGMFSDSQKAGRFIYNGSVLLEKGALNATTTLDGVTEYNKSVNSVEEGELSGSVYQLLLRSKNNWYANAGSGMYEAKSAQTGYFASNSTFLTADSYSQVEYESNMTGGAKATVNIKIGGHDLGEMRPFADGNLSLKGNGALDLNISSSALGAALATTTDFTGSSRSNGLGLNSPIKYSKGAATLDQQANGSLSGDATRTITISNTQNIKYKREDFQDLTLQRAVTGNISSDDVLQGTWNDTISVASHKNTGFLNQSTQDGSTNPYSNLTAEWSREFNMNAFSPSVEKSHIEYTTNTEYLTKRFDPDTQKNVMHNNTLQSQAAFNITNLDYQNLTIDLLNVW